MKKIKLFSLILCLALLLQMGTVPAVATDTVTLPEATESPNQSLVVPFGQVSVMNGCRTIEAMVPLGGSGRLLETAQAAMVYEVETGTMIYAYNPDLELHPGTLSKLVTALIAIEQCGLDEIVTVSSRNISRLPAGSQNQNLKEGEQLTVRDLLHCLILQGANDAAIALAEYIAGNMDAFVVLMNERVAQIGCTHTEFTNIHGLLNGENGISQHTTARDLTKFVMEATKNETFMELFAAQEYEVPETNRSEARSFYSQNYLIEEHNVQKYNYDGVTGGLASYINEFTGASIVATAEKNGMKLVCVILGATRVFHENGWRVENYGNFDEMVALLKYTFDNYKVNKLLYEGMALEQFSVTNGECDVVGQPNVNIDTVLKSDVTMSNLIVKRTEMGGQLTAPIARDQKIATVEVWYRNCCIAEAELFAMNPVRSTLDSGVDIQGSARDDSDVSEFMGIIGTVILIVLIPMVIYLTVNALRRASAQAKRKRRRASRRRSR